MLKVRLGGRVFVAGVDDCGISSFVVMTMSSYH